MSAKQTTNLATINSTQLRAFPVCLAPIGEQLMIVERLRVFHEKLGRQRALLEKYVRTKSGLMQDLLAGKVRVKLEEPECAVAHA